MSATLQPPSGGDVDIGWKLEVGSTVTFLCAAIVVALRCFTRWKFANRGWDDYLMIFALLQALVATILDFIAVNDGLGRHAYYLTWDQDVNQEYYSLLAQVFCVQALSFAKLSIVVSYMRVLRGSGNRTHQVVLWTVGILVLAVNTMVVITFYASCSPTHKAWDPSINGTCWTTDKKLGFILLQGAFSAFSDFFLAIYPIVFLGRLQVRVKTKILIFGLMGLGVLTGVFAIIRTAESATELHLSPEEVPDVSYSTVMGLMWAGMERNIAILIGSVPALNSLAEWVKRTLGSSTSRSDDSYQLSASDRSRRLSDQENGINRSTDYTVVSTQKTGTPGLITSEEYILPVHREASA